MTKDSAKADVAAECERLAKEPISEAAQMWNWVQAAIIALNKAATALRASPQAAPSSAKATEDRPLPEEVRREVLGDLERIRSATRCEPDDPDFTRTERYAHDCATTAKRRIEAALTPRPPGSATQEGE